MSLTPWKKVSEKIVHQNPWWIYKLAKFIAHHGREVDYHIVSTRGFSAVVGVDENGLIPMIRQWRCCIDKESLEFPAGGIEKDQTAIQCAKEEFAQEVGLVAYNLDEIGILSIDAAHSDGKMHIYIASDLISAEDVRPDANEEFEQLRLSPDEIDKRIETGEIHNSHEVAIWKLAKPYILKIIDEKN